MSKELWNLGRVVGYSVYEQYLRYIATEAPGVTPATEKEFMSSMITMGNSMLLKIGVDNISGVHHRDIALPASSKICAANTIMASYFAGSGAVSDNDDSYTGFATRVIDYGPLIENTTSSSPTGTTVPPTDTSVGDISNEMKAQIPEYLKIIDGIVIQPGTWTVSDIQPPYKDFKPKLTQVPTIRISFRDKINVPFFILLTGFSNKWLVQGVSGTDTPLSSDSSSDGDFLGPWVFPWASKIIFSVPPLFMNYATSGGYTRKLPDTATSIVVDNMSIIDFASANPSTYYTLHYNSADAYGNYAAITSDVVDVGFSNTYGAVLATYQTDGSVAPALYGLKVDSGASTGYKFHPVDTVAPGTVKIFTGATADVDAEALETHTAYNLGMYRDDDLVVYQIDNKMAVGSAERHIPLSDDRVEDMAALYMYNTRYLWFYCNAAGGAAPSQEDLESTKGINGIKVISGYVSDQFINDFCVDWQTAYDACEEHHLSDGLHMQRAYVDQIDTIFGADKQYFKFFFQCVGSTYSAEGQQGMFYPVDIRTNRIAVGIENVRTMVSTNGVNFSAGDVISGNIHVPPATTDVMGTYWNAGNASDDYVSQLTDTAGVYVFENHPILYKNIKDYNTFWKPYAAIPKAPSAYNNQFVQWFSSIPVTDILSSDMLTYMGVHSDYYNIDFQSFMQYAATGRDMTEPMSTVTSDTAPTEVTMYLYSATDITTIADSAFVWNSQTYTASVVAKAYMSKLDFFRMAPISIYQFSGDTLTTDVTSTYQDQSHHVWSASGYSGNHRTKSISLTDNTGSPLPTGGTGGKISADTVNWTDLLDSLGQNKSIDLLGDGLKGMKGSGATYLQLGSGQRLYISTTTPTGTIPENSLGIGWGAGIYKYTSGAWSVIS